MVREKSGIINNSFFFLIILFILFFFSCKRSNPLEREPNNNFYGSNRIDLDTTNEGFLDTENDRDFYILEIREPVIVDIALSPVKGVNHAFKIWKDEDSPKLLKYVDDSRKSSPERMCNMFAHKDIYYITVQHGERDKPKANRENTYQLRVSGRAWDSEELESNDSIEESNALEIDNEVSGYFSPSYNRLNRSAISPLREEDWYYFNIELQSYEPMLIDVEVSGVPEVNSIVNLLDSEQEVIASSDLNGIGDGEILKDIGITKSGKYFIMLSTNYESNNVVPYRLLVTARDYNYSSEIEPNNIPGKSNAIIKSEICGRIFPEGDIDYFLYNTEVNTNNASNLYRIKVEPKLDMDFIVKIYNNELKLLYEIDNEKAGGEEIMPNALMSASFYIEVSSGQGDSDQDPAYQLSVSTLPYSKNYEKEPNNKIELATAIKGDSIIGFTSSKRDLDYYYLEYTKRVRKRFTLHGLKEAALKISITDPLGYIIKTETVKGQESKSFSGMIDFKGYIVVESILENYEEPYIIEIEE